METGTGKTYVYLRTIFELNRDYGFSKFVIVVPSIAIKEGVYKTIQMTQDHFSALYGNVPFDYFLYDSAKLNQVRRFATSPNIQIMVLTIGAIRMKDVNNLYKPNEKTGDDKPIDLIKQTRPILIIDEPQSVGTEGSKGQAALDGMNPLCSLRYSATHAKKYHMVYRLDAVDAYERKLVKQIEIASMEVKGGHNKAFLKLVATANKNGQVVADVAVDVQEKTGVRRRTIPVKRGSNLEELTGRSVYANWLVRNISCKQGEEYIQFTNREEPLFLDDSLGDVDEATLKRLMIRRTIKEHLDKELRLKLLGIKVLSLFFIDHVDHYRKYVDGKPVKGLYAEIFEEEYRRVAARPKYNTLFKQIDLDLDACEVHDGYFSIDKKGNWSDTEENNQGNRENAERAYNLIMRHKEQLLSFDTKLRFIFSHSALREGWDNPNVFQICAIRDIGSEQQRRQTIGRGLRLCVNQDGERLHGFDVNTLTVIATEEYEDFAENLQKEIETDTGIKFGIVEKHQFASISAKDESGNVQPLGVEKSEAIWNFLKESGFVDSKGKVQDKLRAALKEGTFSLPTEFETEAGEIQEILRKLAGKLEIRNAAEKREFKTRQAVLDSEEFKSLWERIKYKTIYQVDFDNDKLLVDCADAIRRAPAISKTSVRFRKANIAIGRGGVTSQVTKNSAPTVVESDDIELPDLLSVLQDKTQLTRKSLVQILIKSGRLDDFKLNPQQFIEISTESIKNVKQLALVDGIRYQRLGDDEFYKQERFMEKELIGYLKNMLPVEKSVHEYVMYEYGVEKTFAEELEKNEAVKVYAKLPDWFKVPTPLGSYNPDWAILIEMDGEERLYFVVETKGSLFLEELREHEGAKIKCGKAHFKALAIGENPAKYIQARNIDDLLDNC
jgi:Restriction endonuclease